MLDQFSRTIERIYAAAADASLWKDALRAIEDYTGSTGAVLNLVPKHDAAMPICLSGSFSDEDCAEYAANYMWRCPRINFAISHPDVPVHWDRLILSEKEMDRDATYEWFGSHGLRYYIAAWTGESTDYRAYMSLQRSRRQGHAEVDQIDQFKMLTGHVQHAISLAFRFDALGQESRLSLNVLEHLPHAVFALDEQRRVLLANRRAQAFLNEGDGLVTFGGRLQLRIRARQAQFDKLLTSALETDSIGIKGGWMRVPRASGRRPYVALITKCPRIEAVFSSPCPAALVIITDPEKSNNLDPRALHEVYGLTDAEARLASALSVGHSVESAAASLGIQATTARSELKSVFRKLGINRQQDLVRLLASLSAINL